MFSRLSRSSRMGLNPLKRVQPLLAQTAFFQIVKMSSDATSELNYVPKYPPCDINIKQEITRPDLGHHLMMTFTAADPHLVNSAQRLNEEITPILERNGCSIVNVKPQQFQPMGATVVWTLAESHFSIHTWPEHHTCVIDFFTCQLDAKDICASVRSELIELFGAATDPASILEDISIARGRRMVHANVGIHPGSEDGMLLYMPKNDDLLFEAFSPYQHVKVVKTAGNAFGKILLLDGVIQISETADLYSVALSQPVVDAGGLERLLIIGGGDCKVAKMLFKEHGDSVQMVNIVDIDEMVTTATLEHFEGLRFTDEESKKTAMFFEDAALWIRGYADKVASGEAPAFTGCIIDCTDPSAANGVSRSLFTSEFYGTLSKCLLPGSVVSQQYSHHDDIDAELAPLKEVGYTDIGISECQQVEYMCPLNVVKALTPQL